MTRRVEREFETWVGLEFKLKVNSRVNLEEEGYGPAKADPDI
jgi:hypothetical protein